MLMLHVHTNIFMFWAVDPTFEDIRSGFGKMTLELFNILLIKQLINKLFKLIHELFEKIIITKINNQC